MGVGPDLSQVVDVRWETVVCPAHGGFLRAPANSGDPGPILIVRLGMALFDEAMPNEDLIRAVDPSWDGGEGKAKFEAGRLNEVIVRRPFCYWVDRETLRRVFTELEILHVVVCQRCNRPALGGPYDVEMPFGAQTWQLCLECGLDIGERMHAEHPDGGVWPTDN